MSSFKSRPENIGGLHEEFVEFDITRGTVGGNLECTLLNLLKYAEDRVRIGISRTHSFKSFTRPWVAVTSGCPAQGSDSKALLFVNLNLDLHHRRY